MVWEWAWQSVDRSLKRTRGSCGLHLLAMEARPFIFPSRLRMHCHELRCCATAANEVRVCHQPANGQDDRPRRTAHAARPRRRGDKDKVCCGAYVGLWQILLQKSEIAR